ncbi:hypothetical protein [Streptomyces sp. NPDC004267]|uniref:hypothetical protein n=1 Tax=Streptomyces sp. NPDC004267 TaxID=3364694 RepID=UPI0036D0B961
MVRTRLRLAATLTVVVLALTGFQTGKGGHGGHGKSSSSGGGGCSSSKKSNHDYDDYDGGGSGGSGNSSDDSTYTPSPSASPASDISVEVVDCVDPARTKQKGKPARKADTIAMVRVTPRDSAPQTIEVVLEFERADGSRVDRGEIKVDIDGNGGARLYDVPMDHPGTVAQVKKCVVAEVNDEYGTPLAATVSPSPSAS